MITNIANQNLVQKKLVSPSPNLSLMLPGWCNAKCDFCFWERDQKANKFPSKDYPSRINQYLTDLPKEFSQISITGGEPTISPVFDEILEIVKSHKSQFKKIVLTTNAIQLKQKASKITGVVDHINISRHHYDDTLNNEIFKTSSCPSTQQLHEIINADYGHADICFNCVISPDVTADFCEKFLDYALTFKSIAAVNFRIFHNSLDECAAQQVFEDKYGATTITECPVCRVARQVVKGLQVNWKYSVLEPTQNWNGIYELVAQPDGKLTADWEGRCEINPNSIQPYEKSVEEILLELEEQLWQE